jgi:hypothetical protein
MPLRRLLLAALCLAAVPTALRAADPTPPPPAPVCGVARDPQLVTATGVLHVLDVATTQILRWSLSTGTALPALTVNADVVAFAALPARKSLVIAHSAPPRLTLRALSGVSAEQPFFLLDPNAVLCGLGATDSFVVACVDHAQYLVLDSQGNLIDQEPIGTAAAGTTHSWDGMAWDAALSTLFAARVQGIARSEIAVPIGSNGALGTPTVLDQHDADETIPDELLTLSADGTRLTAPDGLVLATEPFDVDTLPEAASGDVFQVGDDLFTVGAATESGLSGCALSAESAELLPQALLGPVLVRSAAFNGKTFLLRGDAPTATLHKLRTTGDLDGDFAPDAQDVFPLDAVVGKDWDRDGVDDKTDAFPTNKNEWQDSDGDGVGDNEDKFPHDPTKWQDPSAPDSDSDGVPDATDAFPDDPLEQLDSDKDGVGDHGDFEPNDPAVSREPLGPITAVFDLDVGSRAKLLGFSAQVASTGAGTFGMDASHRFVLNLPSGEQLLGSYTKVGKSGKTLKLALDVAALSQVEPDFAAAGASIVANDTANPPSPVLSFVPRAVLGDGTAKLTKKGISVSLRVRFSFVRDPRGGRGSHGALLWRADGTPE